MEIRSLVLFSICVTYVFGGHIESGRCPVLPEIKDFDLNKFQGEWKSILRLPSDTEKEDRSCERIKYTYKFDRRVEVLIHHKNAEEGTTQQISTGEKTYIKNMLELRKDHFSPEYHHWMFQYQNYTYGLLVSCSEALGLFHIEKVWIVSRSSTISQSAMREIRNDLSRMGLGSRKFSSVSHENCNENDLREHNQKEETDDDQKTDGYEFFEIVDDEADSEDEKENDQSNKIETQDSDDEQVKNLRRNQELVQSDGNDSESGAKARSEEDSEKVSEDKDESNDKKSNNKKESSDEESKEDEEDGRDKSEDEKSTKENQRIEEDEENKEAALGNKDIDKGEKITEQQKDQKLSEERSEKVNFNHKREVPFTYEGRDNFYNNHGMMINQLPQSGNNFQQQNGFRVIYDRNDGEQGFGNVNPIFQQTSGSNPFNPPAPINFAPSNNVVYDRNEGNPGYSTYSTDQYQVIQPYDISAYLEIIERWKQERGASSDSSSSSSDSNSGGNGRSESDRERLKQIKERGGLANSATDIRRQKEKQKQILKQRGFAVRAGKEKAGGPGGAHRYPGEAHAHRHR